MAPDGTVYIADTWNDRVQAFGPSFPQYWRGEYYANRWLAEAPVLIREDDEINFDWGDGSPGAGVPVDGFSARWSRYVWFAEGTYRFSLSADDGVRLWVGDHLVVDEWAQSQARSYEPSLQIENGYHCVQLEYYDSSGPAAIQLGWERISQP
jgi:hypothetical protein